MVERCPHGNKSSASFYTFISGFSNHTKQRVWTWSTRPWEYSRLRRTLTDCRMSAAQNEHKMLFAFYLLFAQFYTHTLSPIEPGMDSACWLRLASSPCGFPSRGPVQRKT